MKKKVSLVVPVFNEEDNLHEFYKHATAVMQQEAYDYNIIFVDDGSRDSSALILAELAAQRRAVAAASGPRWFRCRLRRHRGTPHPAPALRRPEEPPRAAAAVP